MANQDYTSIPSKLYKVQATGNDFVMFTDLGNFLTPKAEDIQKVCDRHFGIGADGLIRIGTHENGAYFMDYYNADGSKAKMCGNGVRATVCLLQHLGLFSPDLSELDSSLDNNNAINLMTKAGEKQISAVQTKYGINYCVDLGSYDFSLTDLFTVSFSVLNSETQHTLPAFFADLGNEHLVVDITNTNISLDSIDLTKAPKINVLNEAKQPHANFSATASDISKRVLQNGANIEFIKKFDTTTLNLRVYERGVGETLSCGTGVCASAIITAKSEAGSIVASSAHSDAYIVNTKGGRLEVEVSENTVRLIGSAKVVAEINYLKTE